MLQFSVRELCHGRQNITASRASADFTPAVKVEQILIFYDLARGALYGRGRRCRGIRTRQ